MHTIFILKNMLYRAVSFLPNNYLSFLSWVHLLKLHIAQHPILSSRMGRVAEIPWPVTTFRNPAHDKWSKWFPCAPAIGLVTSIQPHLCQLDLWRMKFPGNFKESSPLLFLRKPLQSAGVSPWTPAISLELKLSRSQGEDKVAWEGKLN